MLLWVGALLLYAQHACASPESVAWQILYNTTDGPNWYRCSEVTSMPCSCSLVNCDTNGSVVKIDLQANTLRGYLPDELGGFAALTHLDVSFNHLYGTLPPSLFGLSALSYLDVSSNLMSGSIPRFVPTKALNVLVLANNHFTGCFPSPITELSSLSMFRVDRNYLSSFLHPDEVQFILKQNDLRLAFLLSNLAPSNQFWCPVPNYTQLVSGDIMAGGCLQLNYQDNPVTYTLTGAEHSDPIKPNIPNFVTTGCEVYFEAVPALPSGLVLNSSTGVISGVPLGPSAAQNFVIHAKSQNVTTSVTISITVIGSVLNSARYDVLLVMLGLMALATLLALFVRHIQTKKRLQEEQFLTSGPTTFAPVGLVEGVVSSVSIPPCSAESSLPLHCRLTLASIYLRDGSAGRKLPKINSSADFRLYTFFRSQTWEALCFVASCAYLFLSIPEFDFHDGQANPWWLVLVEVIILLNHIIDIYLSWRFFQSLTSRLIDGARGLVVLMSLIDLIFHYNFGVLRFSRAFRPLLLILRWHVFRRQVFGILSAIPSVFRVMCVIGIFIFFAAFVGFLLFLHIPGIVPFASLGDAVWNLFLVNAVLAYSLNLLSPILLDSDSAIFAMWFFLLFILFSNYFLLKLIVSYTNVSFTVYANANDEQKKKKQKQAFEKAFEILGEQQKSEITLHMFIMLAQKVRPQLDEIACEKIFHTVVKGGGTTIKTIEEFSLLSQILLLRVSVLSNHSKITNSIHPIINNDHSNNNNVFQTSSSSPPPLSSSISSTSYSSFTTSSSSSGPVSVISRAPASNASSANKPVLAVSLPHNLRVQDQHTTTSTTTTFHVNTTTKATAARTLLPEVSSDIFEVISPASNRTKDDEEEREEEGDNNNNDDDFEQVMDMGELEEEAVNVSNTLSPFASTSTPPPPPPPPPPSPPSPSTSSSSWTKARHFVRRCCKFSFPIKWGTGENAVAMNVRPSRLLIRALVLTSTIQIWAAATQIHDGHMDRGVKLLGQLLAFVFAGELLLKLFSTGPRKSYLAEFTWTLAAFFYSFWNQHQGTTLFPSLMLCISFTRVTKLVRGFSQTSRMLRVLDEALWDAALLLVVYTLLLYAFNCAAMGLYSDVLIPSTTDTRLTKSNWYVSYRTALNFETFPRGLFTMFCCSVMGGRWMDVMTAAVQASEGPDFLAYLLFVSFRIICTMMFLPLSTGMLLQIFMKSQTLVSAEMDGKGVISKAVIRGADGKFFLLATARAGIALPPCLAAINEEVVSKRLLKGGSAIVYPPFKSTTEQKDSFSMKSSIDAKGLKSPLLVTDHDDDAD